MLAGFAEVILICQRAHFSVLALKYRLPLKGPSQPAGARDGAIASLKLRHIDVVESKIDQDARDVRTKFLKSFMTTFFPVGDDIPAMVVDWVNHLRRDKLWGLDDAPFPATMIAVGDDLRFVAAGWTGSTGAPPDRSERYLGRPLRCLGCRTSIRTVFEKPWRCSGENFVDPPRNTRLGRRVLVMSTS